MSKRSELDKQDILRAIDAVMTRIEVLQNQSRYIADDLEIIRKHIDEKEWLLRTPRNAKK